MPISRRGFLAGGLGLLAAGCQQSTRIALPGPQWPPVEGSSSRRVPLPPRQQPAPPVAGRTGTPATPIARSVWSGGAPNLGNIDPMNGVSRITVHHEGSPSPVYFDGFNDTAARLEGIRQVHRSRDWADIGYHYVIDRAGRVWEGRSVIYQGAHAGGANNYHNVGVMVLGNFDIQTPTEAQLQTVVEMVRHLRRTYNVSMGNIYTHQELSPTACPGRNLQPKVEVMRSTGRFA